MHSKCGRGLAPDRASGFNKKNHWQNPTGLCATTPPSLIVRKGRRPSPSRLEIPVMSESVFADRIVQNLLDTDFYKLTMMQAVLHNYPNVEVE